MNTKEAIERLPWLVNGSLEESEAIEVRRHLTDSEECRRELGEVLQASGVFGSQLPVSSVLDYVEGRDTSPFDRELITRHFEVNPRSREEWRLASESLQGATAADNRDTAGQVVPFPAKPAARPGREASWRRLAMAASLAFSVCLAGWIYTLQDGGQAPMINPTIVELDLIDSEMVLRDGSTAESSVTEVVRQVGRPLLLTLPGAAGGSREIELLDAKGQIAWSPELPVQPDGAWFYHVVLPDDLVAGRYTVQLYRLVDGQRAEAERFAIDLR